MIRDANRLRWPTLVTLGVLCILLGGAGCAGRSPWSAAAMSQAPHSAGVTPAAEQAPPSPPDILPSRALRGLRELPEPRLFPDGERFWYVVEEAGASAILAVDPTTDRVWPLVEPRRARAALEALLDREPPGAGLPFTDFEWFGEDDSRISFGIDGVHYLLDLDTYQTRELTTGELQARALREPKPVRAGLFFHSPPIEEVVSPDGQWLATVAEGELWLRSASSDERRRLTDDAMEGFGWDLEGARWSPDGQRLALFKVDRRGVPAVPIVRWTLPASPVEMLPYSRAGEAIPRLELHVVDTATGEHVAADVHGPDAPYLQAVGWGRRGEELYVLRMNRRMDHLELLGVRPDTGASRRILEETSDTFLWGLPFLHGYTAELESLQIMTPLEGSPRFLWTSEREGMRRLYLGDLDGGVLHPLTPQALEVDRLEFVEEAAGWVYFTASELAGHDPYELSFYRVGLEGGEAQKLLTFPDVLELVPTASKRHVMVLRAGLDRLPALELWRADGTLQRTLWTADGSELGRSGWKPPERFTALAADGTTVLHGLLLEPIGFDPSRSYPVVEWIYGGPHTRHVPQGVWDRRLIPAQVLAERGFVVFFLDGRGTPGRGKAFQDVVFGRFGQFEIADHSGALEQLAAQRPYLDLDRVGIFGHSWGGYFTLRALLTRPDLYRVGVASAPGVDTVDMRVPIEAFMGCLPDECPDAYAAGANTPLADRVESRLLMLTPTRDAHIPFTEVMKMSAALIEAGKQFDLMVFPDENHVSLFGPYWTEVVSSYFVEHLGGDGHEPAAGQDPRDR